MKQELIGPTATLTVALLAKVQNSHSEFTHDIVASAFADAYQALQAGIKRVDAEEAQSRRSGPDLKKIQEDLERAKKP